MKKDKAHPLTIEFLDHRFETSRRRQSENGVQFNLTRSDYWWLICSHKSALARINRRYLKWIHGDKKKPFRAGYVLTWISREAYNRKVMNRDTTTFVSAGMSRRNCFLKKGDHHTPESKLKISTTKSGVPQTDEHKKRISEAMYRAWARRKAAVEA